MATWTTILAAYLIGGITFIPLVLITVFTHGYFFLPYRDDPQPPDSDKLDSIVQAGDDTTTLEAAKKQRSDSEFKRTNQDIDVAAGYFAVCREYTPMGINAKPVERATPIGSATVAPPSPSVYQTMYRSIFDRKPAAGALDNSNSNSNMSQRPKKAGNVFYIVLRHGHLMLFDDEEQLEVRHVISLAHHDIGIFSGGDVTPEGELFIKRNALCLTRRLSEPELAPDSQGSNPFYLFSENCSAKEDFYFAMLKNQQHTFGFENMAPRPKQFELKSIISLVQKLHSSEDQVHSRWVNAILGRVFLGVYKTRDLQAFINEKITKKIARVKRPSFLANINIQKIETGDAAPYFSNLRLKDLTVEGECVVEADVKYSGNFRIEVAATARLDLGARFKAREVNLVLAVVLKRLEGHLLFKIKPPPSNRVWFSFQTMPKLEMVIEPVVSSRQITYTVITRQIENRIKEVLAETLVQPFWDDIPFFKTEHKQWRGGIFEGDDTVESASQPAEPIVQVGDVESADSLDVNQDQNETQPIEKSHTIPVIEPQQLNPGSFGRKQDKHGAIPMASASSTSVDIASSSSRSPTIVKTPTEPIVGTETTHADLFRPSTSPPDHATNYMATLHSRSHDASPIPTPSDSPAKTSHLAHISSRSSSSSKEMLGVTENDSEVSSAPITQATRRNTTSSTGSAEGSSSQLPTAPAPGTFRTQSGSLGRNLFRRENSSASASASSADGETSAQKRNTLAAVTNAAAQARQWGWNAFQRQREAIRTGDKSSQIDLSQPMGRGQPLPPPGTPLPGPTPVFRRKPTPYSAPPSEERLPAVFDEIQSTTSSAGAQSPSQRRRRQDSQKKSEDCGQNILIVAAPDDSQPGTPAAENNPDFLESWNESTTEEAPEDGLGWDRKVKSLSISDRVTTGVLPSGDHLTPENSIAVDDDDFSAWMDDDNLVEDDTKHTLTNVSAQIPE